MALYIDKLKELLRTRALQTGKVFRLASGAESNYYLNCKTVSLHGPSLSILSSALADYFDQNKWPAWVAGVSVGGDPIVAGLIVEAHRRGHDLEALLVRKEPKAHGGSQGRAVDGIPSDGLAAGLLIEDVISSGGSSLKAARYLIAEGYKLSGILCLIDREMGGIEILEKELKVPVKSLFKVSQLLDA